MTKFLTVEGDLASADTLTRLTSQGSVSAPSKTLNVGARAIEHLIVGVAPDLAAAGAAGFLVRLGGDGILGGEQTIFVAGAGGAAVQSGADPVGLAMASFILADAGIEVRGGDNIDVSSEMCGDDLGDAHIVVSLKTASQLPRKKLYRSREIEATAVDTKTQLSTLGSQTAPGALLVPQGVTNLEAAIVSMGCDHAAAGSCSAFIRLEGGGMREGPEIIGVGAAGSESTTGASSLVPAKIIPIGVGVTPGNEILIFGEMAGEDIGSIHFGVTLVFS